MKLCDCKEPGFCSRYQKVQPPRLFQICQTDSPDAEAHRQRWLAQRDSVTVEFKAGYKDPAPSPTLLQKFGGFAKAVVKHIATGLHVLPKEHTEARLAICKA